MVLTHVSKKCSLKLMSLGCDAKGVPITLFTFYSVHHVRSCTSTAVRMHIPWWLPFPAFLSCDVYTQGNLRVCLVTSCLVRLFTQMNSTSPSSHCYLPESFYSILLNSTACGLSASFAIFLLLPFSGPFNITIFNIQWTCLFSSLLFQMFNFFLLLYFRHTLKFLYTGVFNFITFRIIT